MKDSMRRYDDIIDLPHPEPLHHPRMSMVQRAAQFAPFAALTGYDDSVHEAARHNAEHGPDCENYSPITESP